MARITALGLVRGQRLPSWLASLDHGHDHAPLGVELVVDVIHKCAHIENATPGRVEEVERVERIRQVGRVESLTAVPHRDMEFFG